KVRFLIIGSICRILPYPFMLSAPRVINSSRQLEVACHFLTTLIARSTKTLLTFFVNTREVMVTWMIIPRAAFSTVVRLPKRFGQRWRHGLRNMQGKLAD